MTISELYELYLHNPKVTTTVETVRLVQFSLLSKVKTLMATSMHPRLLTPDAHMR